MTPPLAIKYLRRGARRNSEPSRDLARAEVCQRSDSANARLSQPRHAVRGASIIVPCSTSPLGLHVGHVLGVRTQTKVLGIHASRGVACVKNAQTGGDLAMESEIRGTVSGETLAGKLNNSVSVTRAIALRLRPAHRVLPYPATRRVLSTRPTNPLSQRQAVREFLARHSPRIAETGRDKQIGGWLP